MLRNTRKTTYFLMLFALLCNLWACQNNEATTNPSDDQVKIDLEKLLGKWQSVKNPKNVIELTTTRMYAYYDGLKLSDESLTIYHNCISRCMPAGVIQMPCLVTDGKKAENCFKLLELTDKKLTYALIGNEDNLLQFHKM